MNESMWARVDTKKICKSFSFGSSFATSVVFQHKEIADLRASSRESRIVFEQLDKSEICLSLHQETQRHDLIHE